MKRVRLPLLFLLLIASFGTHAVAQRSGSAIAVDLELVIAVDVSRSMDAEEFRLQRNGYVAAIRDPDFIRAATAGGARQIALTYVEWSGQEYQRVVVPWTLIDGADAAQTFAASLASNPPDTGRGTSISAAIGFASRLIAGNGFQGLRQTIDLSGDGPNNYGEPVEQARDRAVADGIVINGLPILIRPSPIVPDISRYYANCVIGGPGSFVLPVHKVEEFAAAIRRKLILEVAAGRTAGLVPVKAEAPSDCLAGEKARARYSDQFYPGLDN